MGYWENRKADQMYQAMNDAEKVSQEIADIYAKASRELNFEIQKVYERYRDKFNLSDEEAKKLLNTMRDPSDIDELIRRLKETKGPAAQEILKELESPAYRARIERMQNLQQEIDRVMREVYNQEKKVSTSHYINQYCNAYYQEIFNIQRRVGFQFSFSAVDPKELNRILSMSWAGAVFSERIWKNTEALKRDLKEQLTLGYLTGKSENEMAAEIANKYSTGAYKARRLVRTEAAYMDNQGHMAAYDECGIERYRIVATLDLRTSEQCRGLDGKEYATKDAIVGINYPPFHPFCRTVTIAVLDDTNLAELQRRARDPITGKNVKVPADTTYQKWYNMNVKGKPEAEFAEKVEKNRGADLNRYEKYRKILGKKTLGGNIDEFRKIKYNKPELYEYIKKDYSRQLRLANNPELALPDVGKLNTPEPKFTQYFFGGTNADGLAKGKAFTSRLGYDIENWKEMEKAIRAGSKKYPAKLVKENQNGRYYEQRMILYGKNEAPMNTLVVWMEDAAAGEMRMITAYPEEV